MIYGEVLLIKLSGSSHQQIVSTNRFKSQYNKFGTMGSCYNNIIGIAIWTTPYRRLVTQLWHDLPPRNARSPRCVSILFLFHQIWQCLMKDFWDAAGERNVFYGKNAPLLSVKFKLELFSLVLWAEIFLIQKIIIFCLQPTHRT